MQSLRFGVELETVGLPRKRLAELVALATGGTAILEETYDSRWSVRLPDGRVWNIVPDGSLSDRLNSGEIVSPILTYADLEMLQSVVRIVRKSGAHADDSTGIHVHVEGVRFDAKSATNLIRFIHKQERLLEHALGVSESRLRRYCRPVGQRFMASVDERRPTTLKELRTLWYGNEYETPTRYHESRYHGLNLNSLFLRGTFEFRYFNGSLHAGEVKSYVQLVLALAAHALHARSASSKRRDFNPATAKYDLRVMLLRLGMIGDEFKTARFHLTKRLAGSAAWKGGRPERRTQAAPGAGSPAWTPTPADAAPMPADAAPTPTPAAPTPTGAAAALEEPAIEPEPLRAAA